MQNRCPNCLTPMGRKRNCPCGYKKAEPNVAKGPLTGSLLNGRYTVGNIYNKSNDSTVYIAFDEELSNKVFIRQFTAEGMYENTPFERNIIVQRFIDYEKTLANVSLCKILPRTVDLFTAQENGYLVTEFFEGKSLKELLESGFNFDAKTIKGIVKRLAKGLKVMHNSCIMYGNVSPSNIYILNSGEVKLFGIGSPFFSFIDDIDKKAEYLNPSYAAPELFKNASRGSYCDVYSLAAIYYRLITGIIPPVSFLRSGGESLVSPSAANSQIKKSLCNALLNALNCPVQNRTQSIDAFLAEINAKKVKRRLGFWVIWAKFLGLCQRLYFGKVLPLAQKGLQQLKCLTQKAKKINRVYYFAGGALALLLAVVLTVTLFWGSLGPEEASSITWYYGTGEQSSESLTSGYTSDEQATSSALQWYDIAVTNDVVDCPNLVGLTVDEANKALKKADLGTGNVSYAYSASIQKGRVISQTVSAGEEIEIGKKVGFVISSGTIPQVAGKTMFAAEKELKDAGFNNVNIQFTQSKNPAGTVTSVSAPKEIYKSTAITLNVSGKKAVVPDFTGKTLADAYTQKGGVTIVTVNQSGGAIYVNEGAYNAFVVVSQDLPAQMLAYEGIQVTLTVKLK